MTALGADDVLQEPFTTEDLENAIKSAIGRPPRAWGHEPQDDRGWWFGRKASRSSFADKPIRPVEFIRRQG